MLYHRFAVCLSVIGLMSGWAGAGDQDWPQWRYDAYRSAASPHSLSETLQPLWTVSLGARVPVWDDPLNQDLMTYDRIFEPIVMDGRLFVPFNDSDKLVAYDLATGDPLWTFFAEAPIRFPPVGWQGRIYVCSDDGYLYCLKADTGAIDWQIRGGPTGRRALGNMRLVSAWPARGGPVVRDGTVYFAASIWPFMGTFIYALDAKTGAEIWVNDSTAFDYIKQPHSAPSFAGVAPQGALVATRDALIVPGGRSVPAVFDRQTGELSYFEINAGGKGTGGSFVAATDSEWYVHTRLKGTRQFDLVTGVKTAFMPNEPVLDGAYVYSAEEDNGKPVIRCYTGPKKELAWEIEADGRGDLIRAGDALYAAARGQVSVIRLPQATQPPQLVQTIPVTGDVQRLLAADGKLIAVTLEGDIIALGQPASTALVPQRRSPPVEPLPVSADAVRRAQDLLAQGEAEGYAFWFGADDLELVLGMAAQSPFEQLVIVDPDADKVARLRLQLDRAGLYGKVTCHAAFPEEFSPPQYVAHRVFVGSETVTRGLNAPDLFRELYQGVRPFGGTMHLLCSDAQKSLVAQTVSNLSLEQAQVDTGSAGVVLLRVGPLPGSGDWTHQYGDIANSLKSADERVKLPLGILWFGGTSNLDVLPRHGHGPPEQVIGGRLFIEGMNSLSARDVYTGRLLWKTEFDDLGTFDVYFDATYKDAPLDPAYNQVHIPGANARGTNFVVTEDRVYIVEGALCHVLDSATGKILQDIPLPQDDPNHPKEWGFIGVYENVLLGGVGFAEYRKRHNLTFESDAELRASRAGFGSKSLDRAASLALVGFDRHTGEVLWRTEARHSFLHNGIVAGGGRIYCLDKNPQSVEELLRRRGASAPDTYRIVALDAATGQTAWETSEGIFGTWLGYSKEYDLLLQAGASGSDRLSTEVGQGMTVYQAATGTVLWTKPSLKYAGPCILYHDLIIANANSYSQSAGAFNLLDGSQKMVTNPLTGEVQPWTFTRTHGCNNVIASENLLTFRSGAAGFYDLLGDGGTGNLGGFKSGCTSNLVVAGGVLNAPDYTRTCSCAYQNQTSLAMVHMPELEVWTLHHAANFKDNQKQVRHLGLNFGAPGNRLGDNGLLWVEYPFVAAGSLPLQVQLDGNLSWFRRHSSTMNGTTHPWIFASGVDGITALHMRLAPPPPNPLADGIPVAGVNDDAEEDARGGVDLTSSDLELTDDDGPQIIGLRFAGINLPRGGEVRSAFVQFTCDEPSSDPTQLTIYAEHSGNAARFTTSARNISARPRTTKSITWEPKPWTKAGEANEAQRTPDLAPLIEQVLAHPEWKPGNAIVLVIEGDGKRVAVSTSDQGDGAARLVLDADLAPVRDQPKPAARPYELALYFAAAPGQTPSRRVFDVLVNGEPLIQDVTVVAGSGNASAVVHRIDRILLEGELHLEFRAKEGQPALSGLSLRELSP